MIIPSKFNGYTKDGVRRLYFGGGGSGGGPTQTTVQNTNVPEYAKPYVESMLGATQNQLFTAPGGGPLTKNAEGLYDIGGFKPYQAYGGAYDAQGNQLSYDPSKAIAGFSPTQIAAQQGIAGLQLPSEFDDASMGIKSLINSKNAYTAPTNLGYTSSDAASQGYTSSDAASQGYTSSDAAAFRAEAARLGLSPEALAAKSTYAPTLQQYQMGGPDKVATRSFTDAGTAASYMNPYTTNVIDFQNKELERQAGIASTQRGAQATRAGAFGGSRQAIENAEADRNLAMMKNTNTAQGMQRSYEQAMQQFNAEQGYGLQGQIANQQAGLTVGQQNLGANLGIQQLGTQTGTQVALANLSNEQQTALANQALKGQYGLTQGQFDQGANMQTSAQAQQAAMANAAARNAASQFGAASSNQAALSNAAARNAASQFGAGQNLASAQTAAQYGLAADQLGLQASSQLGALGGQELAARQGIFGLQNQVGAQQQAQEQQKINQSMQDYANAQQYPLMQLGTMSNMLRGLPMQASSTQQYQAPPNQLSQAIGTIGAGTSIYNAFNPTPKAAGGVIKGYAGGGIMSYDMGGEVESQLESMDEQGLAKQAKESSSPSIRKMAQRILRERQMSKQPQGTGPMGVQYQAAQAPMPQMPEMPQMRGGGIIAFARGDTVYGGPSSEAGEGDAAGYDAAGRTMEDRLATEPKGGIMGAVPPAAAPISKSNLAMQRAPDIPDFLKAQYADAERQQQKTNAEHMAERKAAMQEAGVADVSEGQQKQRAEMMAEKSNLAADNERTKNLRMAEFFAKWGSTPGSTLVAGMNALKESVPNILSDEKEQKKVRREIDKSIADLDNATRLEKRGEVDAAMALKVKAAEDTKALGKIITEYQSKRESDASTAKTSKFEAETRAASAKYTADLHLRGEQIRANSSSLDRKAARETADDRKRFDAYSVAATNEQRVIAKITDQTNGKQYQKDLEDIKIAKMPATDAQGNFDSSKVPPPLRPGYDAALARVAAQQKIWDAQKDAAAKDTNLAYSRVQTLPEKTTTTPPVKNRPSLNDPTLQKQ